MSFHERVFRASVLVAFAGLVFASASPHFLCAQQADAPAPLPATEPSVAALPLPEDRGQAGLEQTLKRLSTTASLMMIVAHPDDEDGALLTYLSRGHGVRTTLLTLTRGEGGQNAMSVESYDALGIIRTNELLRAGEFYGTKQLWGTEADFGFSKTQEEAFAKWGHDRVLFDAVLAVRRERPQIIVSTFVGGITDGHGHHQVSGEIAQEVFKAAPDPNVFPEQLQPDRNGNPGVQPWQPLAVYSMVPFAPVTDKGMFDYATGKWAPAKFRNYVTGEYILGIPSTDVKVPVGTLDPWLGRSYAQIARQGWGEQKSQNGGANPSLSGPAAASYHLWAVMPSAQSSSSPANPLTNRSGDSDLFQNSRVYIDTTIAGLARVDSGDAPEWLAQGLQKIDADLKQFTSKCPCDQGIDSAHKLVPIYRETLALRGKVEASNVEAKSKADLLLELDAKIAQFQSALSDLLGLDLVAFRTNDAHAQAAGFRGASADEASRNVTPGEELRVHVHAAQATTATRLDKVWLESRSGDQWKSELLSGAIDPAAPIADPLFTVHAAANAQPTQPFFTRPSIEQPYYDVAPTEWRERSFAPYPLSAWASFTFDGVPIRLGRVVQSLERITGPGGVYQPLVVTPAIGVSVDPSTQILPLDGSALPVHVTIHSQAAAAGTVDLKLPAGWHSEPAIAHFKRDSAGDSDPILFSVTSSAVETGSYSIRAIVHAGDRTYDAGWQSVGYTGLQPYNQYKSAELKTRKVDVKIVPGLRVGYVMGTGDLVPDAIEGIGVPVHALSGAELAASDLSAYNVIVIGIRAYSVRPELAQVQPRLEAFVRAGGTLIVQYQSATFPAPFPVAVGRMAERVVDEQSTVKLLVPTDPLLSSPNVITSADFDGWVEERGHSFLDTWDPRYTALTETGDPGQDPQRGGLIVAHLDKGTYIYIAYALYRQLPELVPGSYRLLANLLSAGHTASTHAR